jgi:phosphate transport system substrate-binding protein
MRTVVCLLKLLTVAAGLMLSRASAQELAVIVNKSNPVDNLTIAQLRKILLAEQSQWPNGKPVMVLLRTPGSPERAVALELACGMTETDFNQHFLHSSFTGGSAAAPKALGSTAMLRQLVTTLPGAVGIIAAADVNDSVKVVKIEGLPPGDAAYKLKK